MDRPEPETAGRPLRRHTGPASDDQRRGEPRFRRNAAAESAESAHRRPDCQAATAHQADQLRRQARHRGRDEDSGGPQGTTDQVVRDPAPGRPDHTGRWLQAHAHASPAGGIYAGHRRRRQVQCICRALQPDVKGPPGQCAGMAGQDQRGRRARHQRHAASTTSRRRHRQRQREAHPP